MRTLIGVALLTTALALGGTGCGDDDTTAGNNNTILPDGGQVNGPVEFDDPALEACVREAFDNAPGPIYAHVLAPVDHLECQDRGIQSLKGLEAMTGLTDLSLYENEIVDITPLRDLTHLESLQLGNNNIEDITPLQNLVSLRRLGLEDNRIAWLGPLSNLTGLQWLNLDNNQITNAELEPLDVLTSLRWLTLEHNPLTSLGSISDVTAGEVDLYSPMDWHVAPVDRLRMPMARAAMLPVDAALTAPVILPGQAPRPLPWEDPTWQTVDQRLDPFALASPNQYDAGSCLFMALTGAMEILLNQHSDLETVEYNGETDLSERYLMNASGHTPGSVAPYYPTDTLYTFNEFGGALLNRDYPFTVGYMKEDENGDQVVAEESDPDAYLSCYYNWIDDLPSDWQDTLTPTPEVDRTIIFVDPARNQNSIWNLGLMNDDIVARIKWELRTKNTPVVVVYNHYGYWHTNVIIGYDDDEASRGCPMVNSTIDYFNEQGYTSYVSKIEAQMAAEGGCSDNGIFYVRDSIYDGSSAQPYYQYADGVSDHYSLRVKKISYNWVKYLANHTYSVHRRKTRE